MPRPRLLDRLNEGLHRKLTLISAPAGFGKTTLVSAWIREGARPAAWLSLDEGDNALPRFLSYLIAALQTVEESIGEGVLALLHSPQPPPAESLLTTLLNDIAAVTEPFLLVLDDYHVVTAPPVDTALAFLLEHLPPQMRLVLTTREDPPLPLPRFRVRDQLTEIRAADLRFTPAEAATFLNQVMGLNLSAEEIAALERRTEGWIAGLQMAALSMQGRADRARFIEAFTGSHRFVLDYLVEEVLYRQPERVRRFLLQTSILDRLSGPLCDAVTGQGGGAQLLEALHRGNLFVVPLDDERHWYRYHHLFADVLQVRLREEQRGEVLTLHQRASAWYERAGSPADAIRHALAAEAWERAAELIEASWRAMSRNYQNTTLLAWMQGLPDDLVRARPVLNVGYAWALLGTGELAAADARLRDAERWLEAHTTEQLVGDEAELRALPATIAGARAYLTQAFGDAAGTVRYTQQALALLPADELAERAIPTSLLGLAYWTRGELEAAYRAFSEAMAIFERVGTVLDTLDIGYMLAEIRMAQGYLRAAASVYHETLQRAHAHTDLAGALTTDQGERVLRGTASLHVALSELHLERGEREAAAEQLRRGEALGEQAAFQDWPHRLRISQARVKQAEGDLDGALERLDEAERLYFRSPLPDVRPIPAMRARVWLAQGRLAEAVGWARAAGLAVEDDPSYIREFEHLTLARLEIAQYRRTGEARTVHGAMALLERLRQAAEEGERPGTVIETLLLQALAQAAQRNVAAALVPLARALTLAEPEGYVRRVVDEGPPMAALLRAAAKQGIAVPYVAHLLTAFGEPDDAPAAPQPLLEPLTDRERDVLRMLATELSGPDIARELMVSLNTLRTHTKRIYSKLGVNSRRAAVRRAEALGLL